MEETSKGYVEEKSLYCYCTGGPIQMKVVRTDIWDPDNKLH